MNYDCYIVGFPGNAGWQTETAGSNINVIADSIPRRAGQFVYGVQQNQMQQFTVSVGSDRIKSRAEIDRIISWLVQMQPHYLIVNQPDMDFYRYKGFFSNPQLVSSGNRQFGLTLTFTCTSPFAYTFPQKKIINITARTNFIFNNDSSDADYLFPKLLIRPLNTTRNFSIINIGDNNREFAFNFASPFPNGDEVITVDNRLQIIQSSMGFSRQRFTQFNMNWFRLLRGKNVLQITGNGLLEIHYVFARRIGA